MNGASDLLGAMLGKLDQQVRTAVAVASLSRRAPVEPEAIFLTKA